MNYSKLLIFKVRIVDCIVFRVSGKYGHFRRPEATTSALTFSCIHPIAVKGLVGAILGIDRKELYEQTKNIIVGIRVISPVITDMQGIKIVPPTGKGGFNVPATMQFIRNPIYEIYINWDIEHLNELEKRLKNKTAAFTPCLGISEFIAKVSFISRTNAIIQNNCTKVDSVIPIRCIINRVYPAEDVTEREDYIPVNNNKFREYIAKEHIIFSTDNAIEGIINTDIWRVGDQNVYFFGI